MPLSQAVEGVLRVASQAGAKSGIAERYASALYDLADERKALDEVAGDLRGMRAALEDSEDLRRLVMSPAIKRDAQARALKAVAKEAGMSELSTNFMGLIARNRRLFALENMISAFLAILADRRGEVTAHVTSARELSADQRDRITDAVKKAVGANAQIEHHIDPSILGGLVVRVGSRMYDSALSSKLQRLEIAMKGAA